MHRDENKQKKLHRIRYENSIKDGQVIRKKDVVPICNAFLNQNQKGRVTNANSHRNGAHTSLEFSGVSSQERFDDLATESQIYRNDNQIYASFIETCTGFGRNKSHMHEVGDYCFHSDIVGTKKVNNLQYKAAKFIILSGPHRMGLTIKDTQKYLDSLEEKGAVRMMWNSANKFWADYRVREKNVLRKLGCWTKMTIPPIRADLPHYVAEIRQLPKAIVHIINSACLLEETVNVRWEKDMFLEPKILRNAEGVRILTNIYTADDMIYTTCALRLKRKDPSVLFIPLQLFIDKANVTRLNKRSMYPVVIYVMCFSRRVNRKLAINVAFLPIVSNYSETGSRVSDDISKLYRGTVINAALQHLLAPLKLDLELQARFPDCKVRKFTPFVHTIVCDLPEAAVLKSVRFGLKTSFPCTRCTVTQDEIGLVRPKRLENRTAIGFNESYSLVRLLPTQKQKEEALKSISLRMPPSFLLERFECHLDHHVLSAELLRNRLMPNIHVKPAGLQSIMKFEAMHNLCLGYTADLLRSIEGYLANSIDCEGRFAVSTAKKIVRNANGHQSLLPRRSVSSMFKLPSAGTMIATSHANVSALELKSSLSVVAFMLRGSTSNLSNGNAGKLIYKLLEYILAYIDIHHYVRRINSVPWHCYDSLDSYLLPRFSYLAETFKETIGKSRLSERVGNTYGGEKRTVKVHMLFCHLIDDIKAGGWLGNFDAQAGESHHVDTRAHYSRTSKRIEAEEKVATRSTIREIGVFDAMYPIAISQNSQENRSRCQNNFPHVQKASAECTNYKKGCDERRECLNEVEMDEKNRDVGTRKRNTRFVKINVTIELVDGLSKDELHLLLERSSREYYQINAGHVFRPALKKLSVRQTVAIAARYPWLDGIGKVDFMINGRYQLIRASSRFYNGEPRYDFIEYLSSTGNSMGQVRLIFCHPYLTKQSEEESTALLVRPLVEIEASKVKESKQLEIEENLTPGAVDWDAETVNLFHNYGCTHLQWFLNDKNRHCHDIVLLKNVLRPVSVLPDFTAPVGIERGTRQWKQKTRKKIELDKMKHQKENHNYDSIQYACRNVQEAECFNDASFSQIAPIRTMADGTLDEPDKTVHRFFYNPFMPWTSPVG